MTSYTLTLSAGLMLGILGLSACQGANTAVAPPATPTLLPTGTSGVAPNEFIPAVFHLSLNAETMTGDITPVRQGMAQPPQNLSFDFDIDQFINPTTLDLTSVSARFNGDIEVGFVHRHPFSYPISANPPSASNRADLGYTGRLVLLTGGIPEFFFGSTVRINPRVIQEPDGYVNPGNLLANQPAIPIVNTYPYVLLVDELENNRPGISNDSNPRGTYIAGSDGWQLSNIGEDNLRWTGFDYLHGGQACANSFVIARDAIAGGSFDLDLAVLIKYTDPRGMGGPSLRLPPAPADVTKFAYRLPYAALDLSRIDVDEANEIAKTAGATVDVTFNVRDWDMTATEAPTHELGSLPQVDRVQAGASGPAVARIDMPALMTAPLPFAFDGGSATGLPGAEAPYTVTLTNDRTPPPGTVVWGAAEFVDPEDDDPNAALYRYGVDPVTIAGDPYRALRRVTYQVVPVTIEPDPVLPTPPSVVRVTKSSSLPTSFETLTFTAEVSGSAYNYKWYFPNGGLEGHEDLYSVFVNTLTIRCSKPGLYTAYVQAIGDDGESAEFPFVFRVVAPNSVESTVLVIDSTIAAHELSVQQAGVRAQAAVIDDTAHALYHYRATRNIPDDASQWAKIQLDPTTALDRPELVLHNDRPVIVYKRTNGKTRIMIGTDVAPDDPSDFMTYSFPDAVDRHSEVVVVGNRLMFAYRNSVTGLLEIARANIELPGASDWIYYACSDAGVETGQPRMFVGGSLTWIFHNRDDGNLQWFGTFEQSPRMSSNWFRQEVVTDTSRYSVRDFFVRDGRPNLMMYDLLYGDTLLFLGNESYPYQEGDWTHYPWRTTQYDAPMYAGRLVGARPVMTTGAGYPFAIPLAYLAMTDYPHSQADFFFWYFEPDSPGNYGTVPVRTLTAASEPRLMMIYANGMGGLRQAVAEIPWS